MFDFERFCLKYGVDYRYSFSKGGRAIRMDCPVCGGRYKYWFWLSQEHGFCHRCRWNPKSLEIFFRALFGERGQLQWDMLLVQFDDGKGPVEVKKEEIPSLEIRPRDLLKSFQIGGEQSSFVECETEEVPPLELPDYFLRLGNENIPTINEYAKSREFEFGDLYDLGLGGCPLGRYKGTLIIPVYYKGQLVFWQSRDVLDRWKKDKNFPKYRTPKGYSPSNCVFNLEKASQFSEVVICEGFFSGLRVGEDAVSVFGNKISDTQISLLKEHEVDSVVYCLDPDTWTIPEKARRMGFVMNPPVVPAMGKMLCNFSKVRVVKLKDKDPDDLGREEGIDELRKKIEGAILVSNIDDILMMLED